MHTYVCDIKEPVTYILHINIRSKGGMNMITISLCMIVKNEEEVIGRCLASVKDIVDEINIVDTGSTDQTKEIVKQYTNRLFDFKWIDDFAAARNYSFEQATKEYILWLDADDVFTDDDRDKLMQLKKSLDHSYDAISMKYHLAFDENGNVTYLLRRYRLVNRKKQFKWIGQVHEFLAVEGNLLDSDVAVSHLPLSHDSNRNLSIYQKMIDDGKQLSPRDTFYFANELMDHAKYDDAITYYELFLQSNQGWIEDNIRACFKLADCYYELGNNHQTLLSTLRTLSYDIPRPEACCRIGYYFMEQNKNIEAIYWYKEALNYKNNELLSFQNTNFSTWLPHLQLCVLYDRIQEHRIAYSHNEEARKYRPTDERIIANKKYFEQILKDSLEE